MKAFILLLGAILFVTACEPEGEQKTEDPSAVPAAVNTDADLSLPPLARREAPASESELGIEGHVWVAKEIGGKDSVENSGVFLSLNRGEVTGKTGCNSYRGGYTLTNPDKIKFTPLMTTRMACAVQSIAEQERVYFDLLSKVATYEKGSDGVLTFKTADGNTIRFVAE